ncbi:unnamed protein product [Lymnaea stagnalis]|uniref:L-Fucosyltransferase n=1 Tax=Lymnaea stagnalis TaxID=6523 RepID=A0AAV2HXJ9_LYMST
MLPRVRKKSVFLTLLVLVLVLVTTLSYYARMMTFKFEPVQQTFYKLSLGDYNTSVRNETSVYAPNNDTLTSRNTSPNTAQSTTPVTAYSTPPAATTPSTTVARRYLITCGEYGQLGNAMFQYAGLLGVAKTNDRVPVIRPQYKLTSIFKLSHVRDVGSDHTFQVVSEAAYGRYDTSLESLPPADILLSAYLQSYKYFHKNAEVVRQEFTFQDHIKQEADDLMASLKPVIKERLPVGVHVRRGDKLLDKDRSQGDLVASDSYFEKAFHDMRTRHGDVVFLIATDDVTWCQNTFGNKSDVIILPPKSREVTVSLLFF